MASQDWLEKDFYAILGVPKDAAAARSRRPTASSRASCTPTPTPGDAAAEQRFKEIGEAYSVLSDPEQRKQYDAIRSMSRGGARFTAAALVARRRGRFEDVFGCMFGRAAPAPARATSRFSTEERGGARPARPGGPARRCSARAAPVPAVAGGFGGVRRTARPAARRRRPAPHDASSFRQARRSGDHRVTLGVRRPRGDRPDPAGRQGRPDASGCAARAPPATAAPRRRPATSPCAVDRTPCSAATATT